jgi:hypothetical protein
VAPPDARRSTPARARPAPARGFCDGRGAADFRGRVIGNGVTGNIPGGDAGRLLLGIRAVIGTGTVGESGWTGVVRGAGIIFFAYIGCEAVSPAA